MTDATRPTYRKHNSFVAIRNSNSAAKEQLLEKLKGFRDTPPSQTDLSTEHNRILSAALADLLDPVVDSDKPVFALSDTVIDEMLSFPDDKVLPRYLVHRYRYEMYPQIKLADDFPPYVQIEPSSICNFRCVFCFETDESFTRKSNGFMGHMTLGTFQRIVDQLEGNVEFLSLASRGEPLLCPEISAMLRYTEGKFLNLKINTNASMLDEEKCHAILSGGVKTVVFSADAAAEPMYSKLRVNGKLSKVLANIERFQKIRETQYPDARVITRVSGVKLTDAQDIDSMENFWGGLVDQVAFVAYNPWENTYNQQDNEITQPCSDLWRRMFIWWDGKVNPCDVDYKSLLSVGNINELSVSELWSSKDYAALRKAHLENMRHACQPCAKCTVT